MKRYLFSLLLIASTACAVTANKVWRVGTSNGYPSWGAVNLGSPNAVTGHLPKANGGTGGCSSGAVVYSDGTDTVCDTSKLSVNTSSGQLQAGGKNVITSSTNATNNLKVLRGCWSGSTVTAGEGFTSSCSVNCTITFSTAFGDVPAVTVTSYDGQGFAASLTGIPTTTAFVAVLNNTGTATIGSKGCFIAVGQR